MGLWGGPYSCEVVTPKVGRASELFQPQVELHLGRLVTACSGQKDGLECVLQRFTAPVQNTPSTGGLEPGSESCAGYNTNWTDVRRPAGTLAEESATPDP